MSGPWCSRLPHPDPHPVGLHALKRAVDHVLERDVPVAGHAEPLVLLRAPREVSVEPDPDDVAAVLDLAGPDPSTSIFSRSIDRRLKSTMPRGLLSTPSRPSALQKSFAVPAGIGTSTTFLFERESMTLLMTWLMAPSPPNTMMTREPPNLFDQNSMVRADVVRVVGGGLLEVHALAPYHAPDAWTASSEPFLLIGLTMMMQAFLDRLDAVHELALFRVCHGYPLRRARAQYSTAHRGQRIES